jgi:hypothetical protein
MPVPLHPQLVFPLSGNRQIRELVFDCVVNFDAGIEQPPSDHVNFQLLPFRWRYAIQELIPIVQALVIGLPEEKQT